MSDEEQAETRTAQLGSSLRRVVLLRETGPKSAAWHRARVQTIWRLHRLLEASATRDDDPGEAGESPER